MFDMDLLKNGCDSCGTCCMSGGPALHAEDFDLVASGMLSLNNLVTIRQGEMVYQPLSDQPEAAEKEFIKIQGRGADWCCMFFDRLSSNCTIYDNRPVACRLLKCWDTEDILSITGKGLLSRFDLIKNDDPLLASVHRHEEECPVPKMDKIALMLDSAEQRDKILEELSRLVNTDLRIRALAAGDHNLTVSMELFYFGRPIFQLLVPAGITCKESLVGLSLNFNSL